MEAKTTWEVWIRPADVHRDLVVFVAIHSDCEAKTGWLENYSKKRCSTSQVAQGFKFKPSAVMFAYYLVKL